MKIGKIWVKFNICCGSKKEHELIKENDLIKTIFFECFLCQNWRIQSCKRFWHVGHEMHDKI